MTEKVEVGVTEEKSDAAAAEVAKDVDLTETNEAVITLSNGARLRVTPAPMMATQLVSKQHPVPKPPMVTVSGEGDGRTWEEENPNDPGYQQALRDRIELITETMLKLMLLKSVHLEHVPDNIIPLESEEWIEELAYLSVDVPQDARTRKIYWLRYEVLGVPKDFKLFETTLSKLGGATEEDIAEAEARFRSLSEPPSGEGLVQL